MQGYLALDLGGSASLSAVCRHIKLARAGDLHDAIEDAWLAMQIYLWLHGCPLQGRLRAAMADQYPLAFRPHRRQHRLRCNPLNTPSRRVRRLIARRSQRAWAAAPRRL